MGLARRLALAALVLAAGDARAEGHELCLDPERSLVEIRLGATLHTVEGRFRLREGRIRFDPESGAAGGAIVVDARSGATGIDARDRRMHDEVLESALHPEIVYRPDGIRIAPAEDGARRVRLAGALTLLGRPHPLELEARVSGDPADVAIDGSVRVPYVAFGLRDVSGLLARVDPEVEVRFQVRGRLDCDAVAAP